MKQNPNLTALLKKTVLVFFIISLISGCKKAQEPSVISSKSNEFNKNVIPTPYFDWSTVDYMPTPSGSPTILVPWANGSVRGFTSDIQYDYLPADGWKLLYNTFDPAKPLPSNPFFVLYNKYRALLRIYVYVTTNGFQNSDYLTTGLNLGPNSINSNMLNYSGQDIVHVNIDSNIQIASKIEPTQISSGVWYATQYEIAYDNNIQTSTFQQIGVNATINWTNVSTISLGGTAEGTIKGSITSPGSSPFSLSKILTGTLDAVGASFFAANKGNSTTNPGEGNKLGLPAAIFNASSSALTSGLSDIVKGFFSGIFGGKTGGTNQSVSLTTNTKINLTGNSTQNGALWPNPGLGLGIPGTINSQSAIGYAPYYNEPMGLFYLANTPNVNATYISYPVNIGDRLNGYYDNQVEYILNSSSINPIWNNVVVNTSADGVSISDFKNEIVLIPNNPEVGGQYEAGFNGTLETIGEKTAYTDSYSVSANMHGRTKLQFPKGKLAVRISFHVTPNSNPAAKFLYVKTFYAVEN